MQYFTKLLPVLFQLFAKECRERVDCRDLKEYDISSRDFKNERKGQGTKKDSTDIGKVRNTKGDKRKRLRNKEEYGTNNDANQCGTDNRNGCETKEVSKDDGKGYDVKDIIDIEKRSGVEKYNLHLGEKANCIEDFINRCCDICWQCAISDPQVLLKFDVIGENFLNISDKFQEYHYTGVLDDNGVSNQTMQVVWPAVVIRNDEENIDILVDNAKGSVIIYKSSAL